MRSRAPSPPPRRRMRLAAPVRLVSVGKNPTVVLDPPALVTCDMVEGLERWVEQSIQPLPSAISVARHQDRGDERLFLPQCSRPRLQPALRARQGQRSRHSRLHHEPRQVCSRSDGLGQDAPRHRARGESADGCGRSRRTHQGRSRKSRTRQSRLCRGAAKEGQTAIPGQDGPAGHVAIERQAGPASTIPPLRGRGSSRAWSVRRGLCRRLPSPSRHRAAQLPAVQARKLERPKASSSRRPKARGTADPHVAGLPARKHDAACQIFGTSIGPEANERHRNHFHVDMAPRKLHKICDE